jgi:hypothetical protein
MRTLFGEEVMCSKGWAERCAHAKNKKCRCACGGANHGSRAQHIALVPTFKKRVSLNHTEVIVGFSTMKIDVTKQKYYSEHKAKKFKDLKDFGRWLSAKCLYEVRFEDHGQDALIWYLDAGGEVLHCEPFQASVWNGMIVDLSRLKVGKEIGVMDTPNQQTKFYDFVVKSISLTKNKVKAKKKAKAKK